MKVRMTLLAAACAVGLTLSPLASGALAAGSGALPKLTTLPGEAFSPAERQAVIQWTLAQPEIRSRLEGRRHRLLSANADFPKEAGRSYRRATLYIRNYDARVTHEVSVDLRTWRLKVEDLVAQVQPSYEEIREAMDLIRGDAPLAELVQDPRLTLDGGFYVPSTDTADPCSRDVCMQFGFMKPNFEKPPARIVIVDLNAQRVVNRDYRRFLEAGQPWRMTEEGGN
jgi:hypothetical protein